MINFPISLFRKNIGQKSHNTVDKCRDMAKCLEFAEVDNLKIPILKYSKAFSEVLQSRINQGFSVVSAEVRFVVAWKGKDDDSETAVILPSVTLERNVIV